MIVPLTAEPTAGGIDVVEQLAAQDRRPPEDRPYVLTNMVASADGGTAVDGRSGELGGPADRVMFAALRGVADVILAGAATVRQERYRPPDPEPRIRAHRRARGQRERPAVAVITGSGRLDPELPLFADPDFEPIVIGGAGADPAALAALAERAHVEQLPGAVVSPREALAVLGRLGHSIVLLEGGPTLNGQFLVADCIDEWNLTISPLLVAGSSRRPAVEEQAVRRRFEPTHVWQGDDLLFLQWRRSTGPI